ncbi:F-box only protein 8-like [Coffea arabica]|uniref:F-box only protein 8-like n=1 Tax=Coffea arabica TaxID=13443 RepID=A0A6P6WC03_COFAR
MEHPPNMLWAEGRTWDDLPDDLLAKILLSEFIGVKTLCKLRCVCKQWRNLLSDPLFQSLHYELSKKHPMLLVLDTYTFDDRDIIYSTNLDLDDGQEDPTAGKNEIMTISTGISHIDGRLRMLSSSSVARGLVCLANSHRYFLCNPSLKELITLPEPTVGRLYVDGGGFGFIDTRNEYIVIHLIAPKPSGPSPIIGCEILRISATVSAAGAGDTNNVNSSSSGILLGGSWERIGSKCPYQMDAVDLEGWGIFVDGVFYWRVETEDGNDIRILSFNLDEERFEEVPRPPARGLLNGYLDDYCRYPSLVELKGNLCLVDPYAATIEPTSMVDIWVLTKDKYQETTTTSSWIKELSIPLPGFDYEFHDIAVVGDVDGDGSLLIYRTGHRMETELTWQPNVWRYSSQHNEFRKLKSLKSFDIPGGEAPLFCLHTDSFFSVRNRRDTDSD